MQQPRRNSSVWRTGSLASLLMAGVCTAQAQGTAAPAGVQPAAQAGSMPAVARPDALLRPAAVPADPRGRNALLAPTVPRRFSVDGEVTVRGTGTDRGRLDQPSGKDIILGVSPKLSLRSRGAHVRFNATVGVDSVQYVKNTDADYVQPRLNADVQTTLVENLLYVDGSASVDRRAVSPYSVQSVDVPSDEQVKTAIVQLTPRIDHRRPSGWNTLLRSDNLWTRRSGEPVTSQSGDSYSQNTQFRFERTPQRFGGGIEADHQTLRYEEDDEDVLRLDSVRASVGLAVTPQLTTWLLAGAERSEFGSAVETDRDLGARVRWAPLERSVLTAEARRRFFGNGFNVKWDHRHRNFGFTLGASREPLVAPESVQLGGDVAAQFDAMFRSRGYTPAQRDALVRATLDSYGLPSDLTNPVSVLVSRPQLATTANGLVSLMGRRTVVVLSAYYRKLSQLQRIDDPVLALAPGDIRQVGGLLSVSFQLTPLSGLDASYRIDDSRGLGVDAGRNSRDQVFSVGSSHSLSPKTRVNLSVQHHRLETTEAARPPSASANSATLGVNYRF